MKKTLFVGFFALSALTFAAGNTYKVNLLQDSIVEGKTLKAGEYKVSVDNGTAVFKRGKESVEVHARIENDSQKFGDTVMTYKGSNDLREIRVGGTHAKIVLDSAAPVQTGQ